MSEVWQHQAWIGTELDEHGNTVNAWADPVDVSGCLFDPGGSREPGFQTRVITEPTLYIWRRTIGSRDRFIGRGEVWEVDGDVGDWLPELPVVVPLRRVEG